MPSPVLRVGLTGNIAAGKSTVAAWLTELGCAVIDLDAVGHECLAPGTPTYEEVVRIFGEAILDAGGRIDRRALGTIVFADADSRRRLEAVLHPAIRDVEQERVDEIAARGSGIVVTEAALLYETGGIERYDRMVVVTAPDDVRRTRLVERGMAAIEAERRMASQMDQAEKARRADYVIENAGTREAAHAATRAVAGSLRRDLVRQLAGEPLEQPPSD